MWKIKKPEFGDQIRVNRGIYYHHAIYASDDCVIQFGTSVGMEISPENATVMITSLVEFARGEEVEVREYSNQEKQMLRKPTDIVNYALSCLGNKGYNLITNNCEHFSYECAFGKKYSEQVNTVFSFLKGR